jgi:hypothetical protein
MQTDEEAIVTGKELAVLEVSLNIWQEAIVPEMFFFISYL